MKHLQAIGTVSLLSLFAVTAFGQSTEYERMQIALDRKAQMFALQDDIYWALMDVKTGKSDDFAGAAVMAAAVPEKLEIFVSLLVPGTARGEAPGARAKPEIWEEPEAFAALVDELKARAADLAAAASTGDSAAYGTAFDAFAEACTACHGLRPSSGGPYRFAHE
jgi:cytochrome c556